MCIWDGAPIQPEDEREEDWRLPDDVAPAFDHPDGTITLPYIIDQPPEPA
jgi:hypothetical protein